jgi:hypothetical protein
MLSAGQTGGNDTPTYKPTVGLLRGVGDKLDEHRSILGNRGLKTAIQAACAMG